MAVRLSCSAAVRLSCSAAVRLRGSAAVRRRGSAAVRRRGSAAVLAVVLLSGCTADRLADDAGPAADATPPAANSASIFATLSQYRDDVAVHRLQIRIHNASTDPVRVDRLGLSWPGIRLADDATPGTIVSPGVMIDIPVLYSAVICGAHPGASDPPPPIEPVAQGALSDPATEPATRLQQIPVEDGLSVLGRIYTADCRVQSVREVVDIALSRWQTAGDAPDAPEAGILRLSRRPSDPGRAPVAVEIDGFSGSVLLDLAAAEPPAAGRPVAMLAAEAAELEVPIIVSSNRRCDGHALGGSSQTFVLQVYLKLGAEPVGIDLVVDPADQDTVYGAIERACGLLGPERAITATPP